MSITVAEGAIKRIDRGAPPAVLSVIVLTYNEETNLPACLDSLRGLNAPVWVVDSGSTDRTLEIATEYGVEIVRHPFFNYAAQRNWALENLPIAESWVLNLDADERLTPELVTEINARLANPPAEVNGFMFRKRTVFMGRWIKHGGHYPSFHLRLFRLAHGRCENRQYDQHFVVDGAVRSMQHDYIDVVGCSLASWTARHTRWAEMEMRELISGDRVKGQVAPSLGGNPIERRRWWRNAYARGPLFARAFIYWVYRYFFRLGFLDGAEGLIFHFLQGFWFRFLVDAMVFEGRRA